MTFNGVVNTTSTIHVTSGGTITVDGAMNSGGSNITTDAGRVTATIDKIPSAGWRTASLVEKRLPLHLETFGGWLNYPCYYFFWAYLEGHLFNSSNYRNEEIETLTNETLHMPVDDPDYAPKIKRMIEIVWNEVPRIALWQPALNVGMNGASDFEYWFHRQLDVRSLKSTKSA